MGPSCPAWPAASTPPLIVACGRSMVSGRRRRQRTRHPYPKQNADIWQWVGDNGLLMSEWPPGTPPEDFHFPLRNRIIAALAEVLVVVESRQRGGSLITAGSLRSRRHRDGSAGLDA